MRLTKYQKARLLEYEWNIINHEPDDENTSWVGFDEDDGQILDKLKDVLNLDKNAKTLKILVVATKTEQ